MLKKPHMTAMALGLVLGAAATVPAFAAGGGGIHLRPRLAPKGRSTTRRKMRA